MLNKGKHRTVDENEGHQNDGEYMNKITQKQMLLEKSEKHGGVLQRKTPSRIKLASCIYILLFCLVLTVVTIGCVYFYVLEKLQSQSQVTAHFLELNNYEKRELAEFTLSKCKTRMSWALENEILEIKERLKPDKFLLTFRPTLSIDFANGLIILSQETTNDSKLHIEQMPLDESESAFSLSSIALPDGMSNCRQLSASLFCCNREYGVAEGTHCYILEEYELASHLFAQSLHMTEFWQSLANEGTFVVVKQSNNDHHVIDTLSASILEIKNVEHRSQLTPISYFFSMESSEELSELAKEGDEFVICEYVKDNNAHYRLAGDERGAICSKTRIIPIKHLDGVKFCANPVYQAVVQYDSEHVRKNKSKIKWMLQVSYNDESDQHVYRLEVVEKHLNSQIALNCEPTRIEIYILAKTSLLKYTVHLPKEDVQSLMANDLDL